MRVIFLQGHCSLANQSVAPGHARGGAVHWPRAHMAGGWRKAPLSFHLALRRHLTRDSCAAARPVAQADPQLAPAPVHTLSCLLWCPAGLPLPTCQHGALHHWKPAPSPMWPSLAPQRAQGGAGCWYPAAAVARGRAGGAALGPEQCYLAPALVRYADQTSYTSTAVLPAPKPSWQRHREASRQTGVGMGPVELLRLLLGC